MHHPEYRIMVRNDDERYFGIGSYQLLKEINEVKSVKEAAENLKLSYSKAWKMLNHMEDALQLQVVDRRQGGAYGGSSELTKDGKKFMASYEAMLKHVAYFVELEFNQQFGWLNDLEEKKN